MRETKKSSTSKKGKVAENEEETPLLSAFSLLAPAFLPRMAKVQSTLHALAQQQQPPQVLLLEGGTLKERTVMALYWGLLHNCERLVQKPSVIQQASLLGDVQEETPEARSESNNGQQVPKSSNSPSIPCCVCPQCTQLANKGFKDLFFFDGQQESIKIDAVRELIGVLGEYPRGDGHRLAVFMEAQAMGQEAANALLKSLEEQQKKTLFVLAVPQREWLLPTLVSRSWVITLPWPAVNYQVSMELMPWLERLAHFIQTGKGLFEHTSKRTELSAQLILQILVECQKALIAVLSLQKPVQKHPLIDVFYGFSQANLRRCEEALANAQEATNGMANQALVLDWLATRLFLLAKASARQ